MDSNNDIKCLWTFQGEDVETQRVRIEIQILSPIESEPFVHVFYTAGNDSVTDILFTGPEARFLRDALNKVYEYTPPK